jgi:hypothetical protein
VTSNERARQYQELPTAHGIYRVDTVSGTAHIITTDGWLRCGRRPAPGNRAAAYDNRSVTLSVLGDGWHVGGQGYLQVSDETYMSGKTWHRTSTILSITDQTEHL